MIALDKETFKEQIQGDQPVLVDFWAPWCGPCRHLAPILEELADEYGESLMIAKVNVDEHPQVAASQGVMSIPTMILYRNGEALERVVGLRPKAQLKSLIDGAVSA